MGLLVTPAALAHSDRFVHRHAGQAVIHDADGSPLLFRAMNTDSAFNVMEGNTRLRELSAFEYLLSPNDARQMAAAGLTFVRVTIDYAHFMPDLAQPIGGPYQFDELGFQWLDRVVATLYAAGIRSIINLHKAPGGCGMGDCWYHEYARHCMTGDNVVPAEEYWQRRLALWREIAARFKDSPAIAGYEPTNETNYQFPYGWPIGQNPPAIDPGDPGWFEYVDAFNEDLEAAIRAVDPDHMLVRGCPHDRKHGLVYIEYLDHLASSGGPTDPNTILAAHSYPPAYFTFGENPTPTGWMNVYPGWITQQGTPRYRDVDSVRATLTAFSSRQQSLGIPIWINETGPQPKGGNKTPWGADQNAADTIRACEEQGLSWAMWGGLGRHHGDTDALAFDLFAPDPWSAHSADWLSFPPGPQGYLYAHENSMRPPGRPVPYFPRRVDLPFPSTFEDDDGWTRDVSAGAGGTWTVSGGTYRASPADKGYASSRAGSSGWTDATISTTVRRDGPESRAGVSLRAISPNRAYRALLASDRLTLSRGNQVLATQPGTFPTGEWIRLSASTRPDPDGVRISAIASTADGTTLASATFLDPTAVAIRRGRVGLFASGGDATFDDVDAGPAGLSLSWGADGPDDRVTLHGGAQRGGGKVHLQDGSSARVHNLPPEGRVSAEIQVENADGAVIALRFAQSSTSWYEARLVGFETSDPDAYAYVELDRVVGDQIERLNVLQGPPAVQRLTPIPLKVGRTYSLAASWQDGLYGTQIDVFVEGQDYPLVRAVDPNPLVGDEATIELSGSGARATVDRVRVEALGVSPWPWPLSGSTGFPDGLVPWAGEWGMGPDGLDAWSDLQSRGVATMAGPAPAGPHDVTGVVRIRSADLSPPNGAGVGVLCASPSECLYVAFRADTTEQLGLGVFATSAFAPITTEPSAMVPMSFPLDTDVPFRIEVRESGGQPRLRVYLDLGSGLPDVPQLDWTSAVPMPRTAGGVVLFARPMGPQPYAEFPAYFQASIRARFQDVDVVPVIVDR